MIYLEVKEISSPIRFKEFVGHTVLIRPMYSAKFNNLRLGTVSDVAVSVRIIPGADQLTRGLPRSVRPLGRIGAAPGV